MTHDGQDRHGRRQAKVRRIDGKRTAQARAATLARRQARQAKRAHVGQARARAAATSGILAA